MAIDETKVKRFTELDPVNLIADDAVLAVSQPDDNNVVRSNKITFSQLKQQFDYDLNIVDMVETDKPDDLDVGVIIGGYVVQAKKITDVPGIVYPTNVPRILTAVQGFIGLTGITYSIPVNTVGFDISTIDVTADTSYFNSLQFIKQTEQSGELRIVPNNNSPTSSTVSVVMLTDADTGITTSIAVRHGVLITQVEVNSSSVSGNVINLVYRGYIHSNQVSAINPVITLSEDLNYTIIYGHDYFNQSYIERFPAGRADMLLQIILNEPFTGQLNVNLKDNFQSFAIDKLFNITYAG